MKIDVSPIHLAPIRYSDVVKPKSANSADRAYIGDDPWVQVRNYTDSISSYLPRYPSTLLACINIKMTLYYHIDTLYPFF